MTLKDMVDRALGTTRREQRDPETPQDRYRAREQAHWDGVRRHRQVAAALKVRKRAAEDKLAALADALGDAGDVGVQLPEEAWETLRELLVCDWLGVRIHGRADRLAGTDPWPLEDLEEAEA